MYQTMKFPRLVLFALMSLMLSGLASPVAASVIPLDGEELSNQSERIVLATVAEIASHRDNSSGLIYTDVTIIVHSYLKGSGRHRFTIRVVGGTVGESTLHVTHVPTFSPGEEMVLFLRPGDDPVVGLEQGKLIVHGGRALGSARLFAVDRDLTIPELSERIGKLTGEAQKAMPPKGGAKGATAVMEPVELTMPPELSRQLGKTPPSKGQPSVLGWTDILNDDFEDGQLTPDWQLATDQTVQYTWGAEAYNPHAGSYSAWCAGTGTPALTPGSDNYPNGMFGWMIHGPFDLTGAAAAEVDFWHDTNSESNYDWLYWVVSVNGTNFYGYRISGNSSGYQNVLFDLTAVPTLGDITGSSQVWFAFVFQSDGSITNPGSYVDDVVIRSNTSGGGGGPVSITSITPGTQSSGTNGQVVIAGSGFGASQGSGVAQFWWNGSQGFVDATIVSWGDNSIVCEVPTHASSGPVRVRNGSGQLSNSYSFVVSFGYLGMKWVGANPMPETWLVNENWSGGAGEGAAMQAAANTWSGAGANFAFNFGGNTSLNAPQNDGSNVVRWGNAPSGAIAATYIWSSGGVITECDMVFNTSLNFSTNGAGGTYDIETIGLHEFGHYLSLADLYGSADNHKVMYGVGTQGATHRNLENEERAGIIWIYGSGGGGTATITFEAQTINAGAHTPMSGGNAVTVNYMSNGAAQQVQVWDGNSQTVQADLGSAYSFDQTSSGSGGLERWRSSAPMSGTIGGPGTITGNYYHQHKPQITLNGTDASHTVSTEARTSYGADATESGVHTSWADWCDAGSMLTLSASTTGSPTYSTTDTRSWEVTSAFSATINYAPAGGGDVTVTVTTNIGSGTSVKVDGATHIAPYTTTWPSGSTHTLDVSSPQGGPDKQYVFDSWSDGGAKQHAVSPTSDATYTAVLNTQWRPSITLNGTDASHTVSHEARTLDGAPNLESGLFASWSGWCDDGATLTFSESTTGAPPRITIDPRSWTVNSAFSATINYAENANVITVVSTSASNGQENVPVSIALDNDLAVGGFSFKLNFDTAALTFTDAEAADPLGTGVVERGTRTTGFETLGAAIDKAAGTVTVLATADLLPPSDPPLPVGSGEIVVIKFDVVPISPPPSSDLTTAITFAGASLSNATGSAQITPVQVDGEITITSYVPGDANGDGTVGIADVVYLINFLLGSGPAPTPMEAADANCDGTVGIADVVYLINFLLGSGPPPCGGTPKVAMFDGEARAQGYPAKRSGDAWIEIPVGLSLDADVGALLAEFELDPAVVAEAAPEVRGAAEGMSLYTERRDGNLKVALVSLVGRHFRPDGAPVLALKVRLNGSAANSTRAVTLKRLEVADAAGQAIPVSASSLASIGSDAARLALPDRFALSQNMPNPFSAQNPGGTTIAFQVPASVGEAALVALQIYNARGQRVMQFAPAKAEPGYHTINWNGRDTDGGLVPAGVYFYRITAGEFSASRKMVVLR